MVSFRWKDYRDGKQKVMTLDVEEFICRFLLHVLPKGFVRIRHYGTLSNANRNKKLAVIKWRMGIKLLRPGHPEKYYQTYWDETSHGVLFVAAY